MGVSLEDVDRIALLARLGLNDDERNSLRTELDSILGYVDKLSALDTTGVPPTASVVDVQTPLRTDGVTNPEAPEAMVANSPDRDGTFFRVPTIIEK